MLVGLLALAQDSPDRPFRFTDCHSVRLGFAPLPTPIESFEADIRAPAQVRLERAGLLAQKSGLTLRFRIIEIPKTGDWLPYVVDVDLFLKDVEVAGHGSGHLSLWSMIGFEAYSDNVTAAKGLSALVGDMTRLFIKDYRGDCR